MDQAPDGNDSGDEEGDAVHLADIPHSKTLHLGLRAQYAPWEIWQAFRELVQNWRDSIIQTFGIPESSFQVIHEDKSQADQDEIIYKAIRVGSQPEECLGYIRFTGKYGDGSVEIVNRSAVIEPWHLDLGGTTKPGMADQAGQHGDGLKIAILAFLRKPQNLSVRCLTGGFLWNFNFDKAGKLVARLQRRQGARTPKELAGSETACCEGLIPFVPNPQVDVIFVLGKVFKIRNGIDKEPLWSAKVGRDEFVGWTKAALFLQTIADDQIVKTSAGDLLLAPSLRGNIYLKGLLLKESAVRGRETISASISGKTLRHGYNFSQGTTNRERQSVGSALEEAKNIQKLWAAALAQRGDLVGDLHEMLNTARPEYADVAQAERAVSHDTVLRLKSYLFHESRAENWYHSQKELNEDRRLRTIIQGLGRKPVQLTDPYWRLLDAHHVVRTAADEQATRFMAAEDASCPDTEFGMYLDRLLHAVFQACEQTSDMTIIWVEGGSMDMLSYYAKDGDVVRMHRGWSILERCAEELGLSISVPESDIALHAVQHLFEDVVEQRSDEFVEDQPCTRKKAKDQEKVRMEQRLREHQQLSRSLALTPKSAYPRSKLVVSWSRDLGWAPEDRLQIQVHRVSSFAGISEDLLLTKDMFLKQDGLDCLTFTAQASDVEIPCVDPWLVVGEEYFVVAGKEDDPRAIPAVCLKSCYMPRPGPAPGPVLRKYTLGDKLEVLDIMKVREWHVAMIGGNKKGVIGLAEPPSSSDLEVEGAGRKRSRPCY